MSTEKIKSHWLRRVGHFRVCPRFSHIWVGWNAKWTQKNKTTLSHRRSRLFPVPCRGELHWGPGLFILTREGNLWWPWRLGAWQLLLLSLCTGQEVKFLHGKWQIPLYFGHFPWLFHFFVCFREFWAKRFNSVNAAVFPRSRKLPMSANLIVSDVLLHLSWP